MSHLVGLQDDIMRCVRRFGDTLSKPCAMFHFEQSSVSHILLMRHGKAIVTSNSLVNFV